MPQIFSREALQDNYEDALLRLVMADYAIAEGGEFLWENEELKKNTDYQVTPEKLRKFQRVIGNAFYKRNLKTMLASTYRSVNKVAAVFIIISVMLFTSVMSVQAFRVSILNFLIGFEEEFTSIQLGDSHSNSIIGSNVYVTWTDAYVPTYIPDGFMVTRLSNEQGYKYIDYAHDDGRAITYYELSAMYESNIDTENAERIEYTEVQGYDALFLEKDDKLSVTWAIEDRLFVISGQVSDDELFKIAEGVRFITP